MEYTSFFKTGWLFPIVLTARYPKILPNKIVSSLDNFASLHRDIIEKKASPAPTLSLKPILKAGHCVNFLSEYLIAEFINLYYFSYFFQ